MQRRYFVTLAIVVLIAGGIWAWDYVRTDLPDIPVPDDPRAQYGLPVIAVVLPNNTRLAAEVVTTRKQQQKGLMFRDRIPPGTSMLFVYDETDYQQIWMKNVKNNLDVVFLDEDKKITHIEENVQAVPPETPDEDIPRVNGRGKYILELGAGEVSRLQLRKGMYLQFDKESGGY